MNAVGNDGHVLSGLQERYHMKSRRTGIHEDRGAVGNKICRRFSDLVLQFDMGHGTDHVILATVRQRLSRKPYSAVKSDDRAFALKCPDIRSQSGAGDTQTLRKDRRVYLSFCRENIKDLFSSVCDTHIQNAIN